MCWDLKVRHVGPPSTRLRYDGNDPTQTPDHPVDDPIERIHGPIHVNLPKEIPS